MNTSISTKLYCLLFIYLNLLGLTLANDGIWECDTIVQCATLEGGECREGICQCPNGFLMNNDRSQCVSESPYLFSPCEETSFCNRLVMGFECHSETRMCVCREGFHYLSGRCWPSVGYGESCTSTSQCNDPIQPLGMECRDGTCVCRDSFYQRELGQCRKRATALGDDCVINEDCQISATPDAVCDLFTLMCVDPNQEPDSTTQEPDSTTEEPDVENGVRNEFSPLHSLLNRLSIAPRALAFEECSSNEDCAELGPAFCGSSNICLCNQGYYPSDNNAACLAEVGTSNPVEGTCLGFLAEVDDENVCTCKAGHFYDLPHKNCRKPARQLGEACIDDVACRTFGVSAYCQAVGTAGLRQCVCDETISTSNIERQFCEPFVSIIGEACEADNNCPGTSECIENICACAVGSIPDAAMITCLVLNLEVGQECAISEQCTATENTACINDRCTCTDGFIEDVENRVCITGIGGECNVDEDCSVANSNCQEVEEPTNSLGECRCNDGFVHDSTSCYRMTSDISSECDVNAQCYNLGTNTSISCTNGVCACTTGHHFRDGRCFERKTLGELCTSTSQCYLLREIENSECRNSICQCISGYRSTIDPDSCSSAARILSLSWMLIIVSLINRLF